MPTLLNGLPYVAALAMWTVSIARWKMVRVRDTRFAWAAMISLAAAQLFQIEPVYRAFETTTGVVGSGAVVKHALTLVSAACVAVLSTEALIPHDGTPTQLRRRLPWIGLTAALAISITPWIIDTPHRLLSALGGRAEYFDTTWRSAVHWTAYLTYLGWALAMTTRACWQFRGAARESASRKTFTYVGLGTAISLTYTIEKALIVVAWLCHRGGSVVVLDQAAEGGICVIGLPLIALGCSYEPLAERVAEFKRQAEFRRALAEITPFAELANQAFPYMRTSFATAQTDERVIAAVATIHEALRQLTCYYPAPDLGRVAASERTARQADWLLRALAVKDLKRAPTLEVAAAPVDDTGHSLDSAWALATLYAQAQRQRAARRSAPSIVSTPTKDTHNAQLQPTA